MPRSAAELDSAGAGRWAQFTAQEGCLRNARFTRVCPAPHVGAFALWSDLFALLLSQELGSGVVAALDVAAAVSAKLFIDDCEFPRTSWCCMACTVSRSEPPASCRVGYWRIASTCGRARSAHEERLHLHAQVVSRFLPHSPQTNRLRRKTHSSLTQCKLQRPAPGRVSRRESRSRSCRSH